MKSKLNSNITKLVLVYFWPITIPRLSSP